MYENGSDNGSTLESKSPFKLLKSLFSRKRRLSSYLENQLAHRLNRRAKIRDGELLPLNMYIIVFKTGVITFHFRQPLIQLMFVDVLEC